MSTISDPTAVEFRAAVRDALDEELARDENVILFGEDIAVAGGVFVTTPGLAEKYGDERVFDTPISELALVGAAFGSAVCGKRPVIEIMFGDFLPLVMDGVINQATKYWYLSNEQGSVPARRALGDRRRRALRRDPLADADRVVPLGAGAQDRLPVDAERRQEPAQAGDPRRQPRALPRAQAAARPQGRDRRRPAAVRQGAHRTRRAPT